MKLKFVTPTKKMKEVDLDITKDLMSFVADQFKQLSKKNLQVPIKLYHL
ncbi:hypothetical protein GYA28_02655 [Candidatus Roizmanbacteria bacterium]|jgi:hypothetical protein|nr:hypothetical protein [Candidatus Roizmanbacteria bacterium]